jgi:hypothetical protein
MAFDETQVERDQGGKFSEKTGAAPEVTLNAAPKPKLRKVTKSKESYYGKRLETADVRIGEEEEILPGSGYLRTPVYLDGERVGYVSSYESTPSVKVARGIRRDLKKRTAYEVVLDEKYGGERVSGYPSRTRSIFTALDRAIGRGAL